MWTTSPKLPSYRPERLLQAKTFFVHKTSLESVDHWDSLFITLRITIKPFLI
jgi:hypothetical protein